MDIAGELLRGPRGRRLCLSAVVAVDETVRSAVPWLARALDPHPGLIIRAGGSGADVPDPVFTEQDIAVAISQADLAPISADIARDAMCDTVDHARYWQEPDGSDAVAALPAVREALRRVAERIVAVLPDPAAPIASHQWAVEWCAASESGPLPRDPATVLAQWTIEQREAEELALRDRPSDPHANFSGEWWSTPFRLLSTRAEPRDALQLVEDSLGWEVATVIPVRGAGRVLELRSASDWADLCREFPMEVTASRRHDWFRVTGSDSARWLIPDWERVAGQWVAVHLTTLAYLSAATRQIDVDGEYATVIAGWGPDATIWLTDVVREADRPRTQWRRLHGENTWIPSGVGDRPGKGKTPAM
jgi:hypothetical protein